MRKRKKEGGRGRERERDLILMGPSHFAQFLEDLCSWPDKQ
jgi:hypothetical protein